MKSGVIILSGGLDSTTLLHQLVNDGWDLKALSFDYGQKHAKELECAAFQAKKFNIEHKICSLGFMNDLFESNLLQSGDAIPDGHYEDESMKQTVVPNRNMILISIAAGYALSHDATHLFYGAHAGDHTIYPDCRPEFVKKLAETLDLCDWNDLNLQAPFQDLDKAQIVKLGHDLEVDFTQTWTCYKGKDKACGTCGSCTERLEAFELNGYTDPLPYQ